MEDVTQTNNDVAVTERRPRPYGRSRLDEENVADADAASDAELSWTPPGGDNLAEVEDHAIPMRKTPAWDTTNQACQSSVMHGPVRFIENAHERLDPTHLDSFRPHPIPGAHSSATLHARFDQAPDAGYTSGAGAGFTIANLPLRRRRDSSSVPGTRPLGPRGPLLSYAEIYGEHNEEDSLDSAPRNTLNSGEAADLGEGHCHRRVIIPGTHTQDENSRAAMEDRPSIQEGQDCARREDERGELQSVDRCSGVTPPPPYEER